MAFEELRKRAWRMLEKRDYGRDELIAKLVEKGGDESEAGQVADRLVELGLIDDLRYAGLVVRHCAQKGWGRDRIKSELYKRRVPRRLWDEALEEMPETDGTLDRLLAARLRGGDVHDRAAVRKATDALRRRGFSWSEISAAVERLRAQSFHD